MKNFDRIYNQDCITGMKKIPSDSIDMVITSPPYDNLRDYNNSSIWNFDIFEQVADELYRVCKTGAVVVWIVNDAMVNKSETGTSFRQALYFKDIGFLIHDTMIWQKISPFQHHNRYIQSFEYMFVFSKRAAPKTANLICDRRNKYAGTQVHGSERQKSGKTRPLSEVQKSKTVKEYGARFNIWDIPPVKQNKTGHPAPFPVELIADHIQTWSKEGDLILDPFIGSGTTAVAAIQAKRHFLGFEVDKEYYNNAINRVKDETKLTAEPQKTKDFEEKLKECLDLLT